MRKGHRLLTWILLGFSLTLLWGVFRLYGIVSELRSKLHGTKTELSKTILRFNRWKHYAHVLEIRAVEYGVKGEQRDAFRAKYINDFQEWGSEYGKRTSE